MEKIVALVPMRHHSQRVPEKNYRVLAGKPLFHHIIDTLLSVPEISQIVVDTDSHEISAGILKRFHNVILIDRPEALSSADTPMNAIIKYDASKIDADFYIQTHSTNPLLKTETISRAIQTFLQNHPRYDSLFSVTRLQTRLWDQNTEPINHHPAILKQTQDLAPIYEENSCIYIFGRDQIGHTGNRIGKNPLMFEINSNEAWDIDEESDFIVADLLMKARIDNFEVEE